jgi:cytochrome c oxidase cbb3-type subunit 3
MTTKHQHAYLALFLSALVLTACERETRSFDPGAPSAEIVHLTRLTDLQAGGQDPNEKKNEPSVAVEGNVNYEENAHALSEGQRLYSAYNCVGCHAHGGGGMGPALMDDKWIYGHQPTQVFRTIVEGRPNGMPSFGGKVPAFQVWQLAAYVRSMSGLVSKDAAPGRDDHMKTSPPPNSAKTAKPAESSSSAVEKPQ